MIPKDRSIPACRKGRRTRLLVLAALGLACSGACSDEPVVDATPDAGGGTGGTITDGAAGAAGVAGSAGHDAGQDGSAGQSGSDAGQAGNDAGQAGSDAGQAGSDAGQAGSDAGQAGSDAGQAGSDAGQAGSDAGGTGGSAGAAVFDCPAAVPDVAAAADAGAATDAAPPDAEAGSDAGAAVRVRIAAANVTSDNYQAYEAPGIRILQGLAPDIVLIQEFNYRHGTLRDLVTTAFGPAFCFFREAQVGGIPNGVVSRYPIVAYGEWQDVNVPDRDFAWTRIDVPGPVDLWAVSVHLKTASTSTRAAQAQELVGYIQAQVPSGDYLVVGGDLNTDTTTETAIFDLSALLVTGGARPVDQNGNDNTNANRNKPYDWVLPNAALAARELPVQIGSSAYASGLVFDSRVYTPLSEVAPIQSGDCGVSGMQHMAVVKDFALPAQ